MADDSARNPEADTFHYIRLVIEALNKMSRLDIAIDTIEQRLPVELFKVVEKSNNEVAQRHPSTIRAYANKTRSKTDAIVDGDEVRTALLNDLLWTLYARFEAIAEGHRVVHDVVAGIARREHLQDAPTLTRGFKELWKLYQSEVSSYVDSRNLNVLTRYCRCVPCFTITLLLMVTFHTEEYKGRPPAEVFSRGASVTAIRGCSSCLTWTSSRQN